MSHSCVTGRRVLWYRDALGVALLTLCACAQVRKSDPIVPPSPPAKVTPAKPTAHAVTPPPKSTSGTVVASLSGIAVLDDGNFEQEKTRIKLALAKSGRDALESTEVGYYLDVLHARLKQVSGSSLRIERQGDRILVDLPLAFDAQSAQITPAVDEILSPLSKVLVEYRMTLVSLQIRPEQTDPEVLNSRLAQQRLSAVAHDFVQAGVIGKRIVIVRPAERAAPSANEKPEGSTYIGLQIEPIIRADDSTP
jgi:outer membrane protein OmpA-like peptidoglycan-associated protein